jgi:class 3 adenylate cyclase
MTSLRPETQYARNGEVHIAYQVFGEGEFDVVIVNGLLSHVELIWDFEPMRRGIDALASFARVITFDRRGSGLSDPVPEAPTLEQRMDDMRTVLDAAGSERAVLLGISEGVPMSIVFAATYPDRVQALVCCGGMARTTFADDYPWGMPVDALMESGLELVFPFWGQGASIEFAAPSVAHVPEARAFFARMERATATPGMLGALMQMFLEIDIRDVVPSVHVPTLILHCRRDRLVNIGHARWLAAHMPNAKLVELEGDDHTMFGEHREVSLAEMREFLTGTREAPRPARLLATVLFTDIVDSTKTAAEFGDERWRETLQSHQDTVRSRLSRFGGREIKTTGDGFLATFDGPERAIQCAREILDSSEEQGILVRAGLHTGECEVMGDDIAGMSVHIAARVNALAGPSEVLVSQTVKDLVVGSGIGFDDRGEHTLKGVPDSWQLYAAAAG